MKIITWLRDVGMDDCILNGMSHARRITHMELWPQTKTSYWGLTGQALKTLGWIFLGEALLFVANKILAPIYRLFGWRQW